MRFTILFIVVLALGCTKTIPVPETPDRLPISDKVEEVVSLPEYVEPTKGSAARLLEGDTAPFPGVLLDEAKAFGAGELRIAYDEIYRIAKIQQSAYLVSLRIMERELLAADSEILKKEAVLREIRDSWWSKHKGFIFVATGFIIGGCSVIGAGIVWAKIEN